MKDRTIGIAQVIASGVCFGFLGLFGKTLYEQNVKPGELLSLRFIFAALMTFIFLAFKARHKLKLSGKEWFRCAALGMFGYALFSFCFFSALRGLSASLTVLLLYTYPVLVALGAWIFFGESISKRHLLAFPVAALGLIGLVWGDIAMDKMQSLLFGIGSSIFYALYILASSRWLKNTDPLASTPIIQACAGLTLGSLYLRDMSHTFELIRNNWLVIVLIAFIGTVLAMSLFLAGLQKLKSWEVSILSTTEPLTGVLLALLFLGETLSVQQVLGMSGILAALVWVSRPDPALHGV